jgi:hypothetical protein
MALIMNEQTAAHLLDFSQKLDIGLLDSVVNCMYCGDPPTVSTGEGSGNEIRDFQKRRFSSLFSF